VAPAAPIRVVTFDFWNTLMRADDAGARDRRLASWLGLLAGEGFDFERDVIHGAMRLAGRNFDESWKANRIYTADDAVRDMLVHLGIEPSPATRERLLASIVSRDPEHFPDPNPNVAAALDALRDAGVRVGIICDVGLSPSTTLRHFLEHHDLLRRFDHWSFSDEVGTFKPDPVIFAHALAGLGGVDPSEAAHIGDLRRTDVAGAQGAGWFAIRYTGAYDDPGAESDGSAQDEADAVIADMSQLVGVLGL
jgi:putative hydrolase of the HAD superfamily